MSTIARKDFAGAPIDVAGNTVKVLFSCSGNLDRVGDVMAETALDRTTRHSSSWPLMWRHDLTSLPLGTVERIEKRTVSQLPSTIKLSFPEVTGGWVAIARVYQSDRGRELLAILRDNAELGASFGYKIQNARKGRTKHGKPARILEDVDLLEVSVLEPGGQANLAAMVIKSQAQIDRETKALLDWFDHTFREPERERRAACDRLIAEIAPLFDADAQYAEIDAMCRAIGII